MNGRFIVFDTETPNHRNDRICSIGITVVENNRITDELYELIDPEAEFDPFNVQLHGISPEMVSGKPSFRDIWPGIEPILNSGLLVAHNAQFDMAVISKCLRHYNIEWLPEVNYACTCQMSRKCMPEAPNHRLNTLSEMLCIDLEHHNASSDSQACAEILIYLLNKRHTDINLFIRNYNVYQIKTANGSYR